MRTKTIGILIMLAVLIVLAGCKDNEKIYSDEIRLIGGNKTRSESLTLEELLPITIEAKNRWRKLIVNKPKYERILSNIKYYKIVRFKNNAIGECWEIGEGDYAGIFEIEIDDNANGFGWYIDKTPEIDEEFIHYNKSHILHAPVSSKAYSKADLLSIVMHEMGHALGLDDNDDEELLMRRCFMTSIRINPSTKELFGDNK